MREAENRRRECGSGNIDQHMPPGRATARPDRPRSACGRCGAQGALRRCSHSRQKAAKQLRIKPLRTSSSPGSRRMAYSSSRRTVMNTRERDATSSTYSIYPERQDRMARALRAGTGGRPKRSQYKTDVHLESFFPAPADGHVEKNTCGVVDFQNKILWAEKYPTACAKADPCRHARP